MSDAPIEPSAPPLSEDWFLEQIAAPDFELGPVRASIELLAERGATGQADGRAKLLQDVLVERGREAEALDVLALRASWAEGGAAAAMVRDELFAMVGAESDRRRMVDDIGLDRAPAPECVRRMGTLLRLQPGLFCRDRTWGFGVVRDVDHFERRVTIDFERRAGHRMTFAYAAESIRVLDEGHLLVRLHRDREGVLAMARERPGDVVRMALESFGPLTPAQLQEELSPRIVPASEWKSFWDSARRQLRSGGSVTFPSKRAEPLRLQQPADEAAQDWKKALGTDRDPESILQRVAGALRAGRVADDEARAAVGARLDFVRRSAGRRHPERAARAALLAEAAGVDETAFPMADLLAAWRDGAALVRTVHALTGRETGEFLAFLLRREGADAARRMIEHLADWKATTLADVMDLLLASEARDAVIAKVRELVARRVVDVEVLLWLHRHPEAWEGWGLGMWADFARLALVALEKDHSGERLKAQNALRERIEKPAWLAALFDGAAEAVRLDLFERFRRSSAWPAIDRRAVLAHIVRVRPELEALLRETPAARPAAAARTWTSQRSFDERREQLRRLIEEEIPKNGREIGVARSYGDLRENFEYKAAKDMQGLLIRRRAELEAALKEVRPTTFDDAPGDRVGPGVGVDLEYGDGRRERLWILGVWDSDAERGVISCDSRLAQLLEGRRAGDSVRLPLAEGVEADALVVAILPLSDELRRWVRGGA